MAVIKGKFHEERSNIAAYVRFTEKEMAVKATALNGSVLEGHTIRAALQIYALSDSFETNISSHVNQI